MSYLLYLLRPKFFVLCLSINRNSSLLIFLRETFFTTTILKFFKHIILLECLSLACMDNAHFSLKHALCPFVRLWHFCMVLPKYDLPFTQRLHIHKYIAFFLQYNFMGTFILFLLTSTLFTLATNGHCLHPGALHF